VVSSLGLTFLKDSLRHSIYDQAAKVLKADGTLTQYLYIHGETVAFRKFDGKFRQFPARSFFGGRFDDISRRRVWKNIPPAFVYTCRGPRR